MVVVQFHPVPLMRERKAPTILGKLGLQKQRIRAVNEKMDETRIKSFFMGALFGYSTAVNCVLIAVILMS